MDAVFIGPTEDVVVGDSDAVNTSARRLQVSHAF